MKTVVEIVLLCVSLVANAASFTATVEAYNRAALTGEVPDNVSVAFANDGGSKGQVGKDHLATLTISNWPEAIIQQVTLYVHSNKSAGAAAVYLSLADSTWQLADGAFSSWPGMSGFSTSDMPLPALTAACRVNYGSSLRITIAASSNSVYLSRVVVDYQQAPPTPAHLSLLAVSALGTVQTQTLEEQSVGDGFFLPSVTDAVVPFAGKNWHFLGWCEQPQSEQDQPPYYWSAGDWYSCSYWGTLYALYTDVPTQTIAPISHLESGEYALLFAYDNLSMALSGTWTNNRLNLTSVDRGTQDLSWNTGSVAANMRYMLSVEGDSVTIAHVASSTWIGHTAASGSKTRTKWAWRPAINGTIYFYGDWRVEQGDTITMALLPVEDGEDITGSYTKNFFHLNFPYWHLYPTSTLPLPASQYFTTFPSITATPAVSASPSLPQRTKIRDHQGRILMTTPYGKYTLLGNPL